ncbi:hypothetical protein JCM5353_001040 [Sporobolomyces roseus]
MSFSSLPQELVDHIAFCIGVAEQGRDNVLNVKNLVNFCLVSKQILSSARAALYRRPFAWPKSLHGDYTFGVGQYKADGLLRALEANGCALGRLVRGTFGINGWLYTSGDCARIRRWYCAVLRACTGLRQVDLHFTSQAELEDLLQILSLPDPSVTQNPASEPTLPFSTTLSRLQCLDFNDRQWKRQQGNQVYISDVFTMFARFDFSLDTVNFRRVYWSKGDDGSTPLFPFLIKHLRIWTMSQYLMDSIALSSSFPSGLETFDFVSLALEGTIDLTPCKTHHGGRLQKLELTINEHQKRDRLQLSEYTTTLPDVKIVLEGLQSYPLLTSLILSGTHGPSLRLLSTLAKSSPLLRNLDLSESRWISDSHPLSTVPDDIFPETRVLAELEQFKHIEHVHLGLLPTIDQNRYGTLVESLELRGVKVRFDCCVEDEESESE